MIIKPLFAIAACLIASATPAAAGETWVKIVTWMISPAKRQHAEPGSAVGTACYADIQSLVRRSHFAYINVVCTLVTENGTPFFPIEKVVKAGYSGVPQFNCTNRTSLDEKKNAWTIWKDDVTRKAGELACR
jgi:hypothetical protein